jgi:hypothetical protein
MRYRKDSMGDSSTSLRYARNDDLRKCYKNSTNETAI